MSSPALGRDGSGNSPASITANGGFAANGRSYDEIEISYISLYYPLTMISLYGFHRKEGAETRIRGNKPRRGAGSFQGGIDEAVCSSVRGCVRRRAFGRRRIRARGPGADDPVGASQQHRPSCQPRREEIRGNPARQERRQAEGSRVRLIPARQRVAAAIGAARRHAGDAVGFHHLARNRHSRIRPARFPVHRQHHRSG